MGDGSNYTFHLTTGETFTARVEGTQRLDSGDVLVLDNGRHIGVGKLESIEVGDRVLKANGLRLADIGLDADGRFIDGNELVEAVDPGTLIPVEDFVPNQPAQDPVHVEAPSPLVSNEFIGESFGQPQAAPDVPPAVTPVVPDGSEPLINEG